MIRIVPAIDLIGGRCVRLTRGDYATKKVYDASPVETARRYADCGVQRIHLVDLDGAKASRPCNLSVLEQIAAAVSCELEWGGGIASSEDLARVFDAGASHAIIGSVAALQPERFEEWLSRWGSRMVLGADVRQTEGRWRVAVKGWQEEAPLSLDAILRRFAGRELREAIVTDIGRDGMLQGPTTGLYVQLQAAFPQVTFTVSGGVSSMDDIRALDAAGLQKAIVGKALYENRITLKDIALWSQKESYPASM
ncbi:MAG: 1-(5-phosphoribosyl)-5-[(5-phosphoribosylamino)methylideneamino]imidazole-4-carboxamide isomerase [Bacteroidales bacterium]|nr:1-(5-phosphoribosyl)-5-[(5-phosphoribosylamino)methylideneamino]imidazole-4-carboxamide isomerase [Bacteroidales bacterium]